jgi:Mn2+/Fe2+ NRAMP family transporter
VWATIVVVAAVTLVWLESYAFLEKAQVLIVALLLGCLFVATLAAQPDWLAVLLGLVTPQVPEYEPWVAAKFPDIAANAPWVEVATCLGAVGGGTYDYIGYVGFLREKKWGAIGRLESPSEYATKTPAMPLPIDADAENTRRGLRWLLPAKIDTGVGFFAVLLFTICFVLLGARFLHTQELAPAGRELFNHQAQFLTELHPALLYLYQLGIFMAFFGTIYGAYEVYARTAFECLIPVNQRIREMPFGRFRRGLVLYCAGFGLLLLWTLPMNPDDIVRPAAIVGGVFTCGLWCLAMMWIDRRFLPAALQMPRLLWLATAVSGVVLTLLGVKGMWDYVAGFVSA